MACREDIQAKHSPARAETRGQEQNLDVCASWESGESAYGPRSGADAILAPLPVVSTTADELLTAAFLSVYSTRSWWTCSAVALQPAEAQCRCRWCASGATSTKHLHRPSDRLPARVSAVHVLRIEARLAQLDRGPAADVEAVCAIHDHRF